MARSAARRTSGRVELYSGDRMTQPEFHRLYEQTPKDFRAELIGGIVYVSSPLKRRHGTSHPALATVFFTYHGHTPGVECGDNTTIQLGEEGEPQPDLYLRILPERICLRLIYGPADALWIGSPRGGQTAAVLFSITSTYQRLEVEAWAYLQDVRTRLPPMPAGQIGDLLPDHWQAARHAKLATGPAPATDPTAGSGESAS